MGNKTMEVVAVALCILQLGSLLIAEAVHDERRKKVIHLGGKAVCQDCTQPQAWSSAPFKAGTEMGVSIRCPKATKMSIYRGSATTDANGQFNIEVSEERNFEGCFVKVFTSGDSACNVPTNRGSQGKSGVVLKHSNVMSGDLVKYNLGSFFFTTPSCAGDFLNEKECSPCHG